VNDDDEAPATPAAGVPIKRAAPKSARRRSRELAMQGLYEWLVSGSSAATIEAHIQEMDGFGKCDREHFDALLHSGIEQAAALDAVLARHVDRKTTLLSPVEHAVLMVGVFELMNCLDIPYRVAINEAVELAKTFGGTDGHRYVNGVLDKCAAELRTLERREAPVRRAARPDPPKPTAADVPATASDSTPDRAPGDR
jgi:N utilization substance protein B